MDEWAAILFALLAFIYIWAPVANKLRAWRHLSAAGATLERAAWPSLALAKRQPAGQPNRRH